jgi:site-specific recombinase XerD
MVTKRFSLLFRLKKPRGYEKGNMLVYMRITVDSERTEISANREFDPARWNKKIGRASGTKEDARAMNAYLDALQVKVYEAHRELIDAKEEVTAEKLKIKLQGKEIKKPKMLLEVFLEHNQQMEKLIEKGEYAKGTKTRFETAYRHTKAFLKAKYGVEDIPISNLDYGFISDFEFYLKSEVCAHNTAMKYLGNFKKIVLNCVRRNWLPRDPFLGYKLPKREVEKDFLMDDELQRLAEKQLSTERLTQVRDIFVFSCYTGLAYADVKKLKRSEIKTGIDGKKWLFVKRQKTTTPSPVPLLPVALSVLDKYKDHARCIASDRALPVLCNQKMNEYLKEIADVCGVTKTLTYHTARHTFATTVTLNNNVPIESVSKMLGHKNLKQTQHYAKILNKKISLDMQELTEKLAIQQIDSHSKFAR